MRILQLSPRYPFPPDDGGKIGIANITKEFSNFADVTFFTFDTGDLSINDKSLIEPYAELVTHNHSTANSSLRIARSLFQKDSLYITKHQSAEIIAKLDSLVSENQFDIIHADHTCMAPLALQLSKKYNIPVGLRLHNIEWTIWQRYADVLNPYHPKRLFIQSQAKKLKKNEKEILDQVDIAFAITEEDKRRAMELSPDLNVVVASAGVNLSEWVVDRSTKRNRQELILATTYQWQHNIDAVKWFIENVLTKLHTLYPDIKLTLIGKNAPNWLADYKNIGVNLVGYVEKVQPYLNQAGIYVSPLFVGGGIRIKILEAMAMELPVLATNIAAEGIKCKNGDGLIICNSAEDYIRHVSKLIEDPDYSKSLVSNSVAFISENYSWKQNVEKMILEYRQLQKRYRNISKNDYFVK